MAGLISPEVLDGMLLLVLALWIAVALSGGLMVHAWIAFWRAWSRFWDAVRAYVYLKKPWRVAWSRACRRIP